MCYDMKKTVESSSKKGTVSNPMKRDIHKRDMCRKGERECPLCQRIWAMVH